MPVPGGRYDGALGVIAGLIALRTLREQFGTPRRTLDLVSFCEEEPSRFPATNLWGSRAVTGLIGSEEPETLRDCDGVTISEAIKLGSLRPPTTGTTCSWAYLRGQLVRTRW